MPLPVLAAPTAAQLLELRRMVAEPTTTPYADADLTVYINRYPLTDLLGRWMYWTSYTYPPAYIANPYWSPTYDLNAAAADIWAEKAAALQMQVTFTADGSMVQLSHQWEQAMKMEHYYRARRSPNSYMLRPDPEPRYPYGESPAINLPEAP